MPDARATLIAVWAVLLTPILLAGRGWERLLRAPQRMPTRRALPDESVGLAERLLSRLARTRLGVWRDTCLYQSVATCLVLRHYGTPAVLKLGAKREGEAVAAHAWVDTGSGVGGSGHRVLESAKH
jgi:hypothetical protein